jgi:Rieske Fe-S protein
MTPPTRRDVLKVLVAASAVPLVPACGSGGPSGDIAAGNVSSVPVGTLEGIPGEAVILGRDPGGLYAMTAICTHQGCNMESNGSINPQGIHCGCHGSAFDTNGNVVQGPASAPLTHFSVSVDAAGAITIHASNPVSESQRTPA